MADAILSLGDNIIIETPPSDDIFANRHPSIPLTEEYLLNQEGEIICETPRHTNPKVKGKMIWFQKEKKHLNRTHWFVKKLYQPYYPYLEIESDFEQKTGIKNLNNYRYPWHKGINLLTFKMLHGVFPPPERVEEEISRLHGMPNPDFFPWNMVVQGDKLVAIDRVDGRWKLDLDVCDNYTMQMIKHQGPEQMLQWFLLNWMPFIETQEGIIPYISWCIGSEEE